MGLTAANRRGSLDRLLYMDGITWPAANPTDDT